MRNDPNVTPLTAVDPRAQTLPNGVTIKQIVTRNANASLQEVEQKIEDLTTEDHQAFDKFMLWSLSEDKADLTPNKFAKMNPSMAK